MADGDPSIGHPENLRVMSNPFGEHFFCHLREDLKLLPRKDSFGCRAPFRLPDPLPREAGPYESR